MEKGYNFKIEPTEEQRHLIECTFGCVRYVYNCALDYRKTEYEQNHRSVSMYETQKLIVEWKKQFEWLKDVDSTALQYSNRNVQKAYDHMFSEIKRKKEGTYKGKIHEPKFKKKRDSNPSYTSVNNKNTIRIVDDQYLRMPKLGNVRCRFSKEVEGRILSATVTRNATGKYFVSIACTDVPEAELPKTGKSVGVDLGLKYRAVTSDGVKYENGKYTDKYAKKLAREQRKLFRKPKGSNNYEKQRLVKGRIDVKIANCRKDAINKMTTELVQNNDVIVIEDLYTIGMLKNRHLSKAIQDAGWGEIKRQLKYKCERYGKTLVIIDRYYPSSQVCSECGYRNRDVKDLKIRDWVCPICGKHHDRDINAAVNILAEGNRVLIKPAV